jgi:hypothetical protein
MKVCTAYCLGLALSLVACGSSNAPEPTPNNTVVRRAVTVTGHGKVMMVPAHQSSPGLSAVNVDVMALDALLDPKVSIAPQGPASLGHMAMQSASTACEDEGCLWTMPRVELAQASAGLVAVTADARAAGALWATTYAGIVNPNQVFDSSARGTPIDASAPGYVLAQASIVKLAELLGLDGPTLVARGVFIGRVWSSRGEGEGMGTPVAGAAVTVAEAQATAPAVYYLNDALTALARNGTNQDGLFVMVGAPDAPVPPSYRVPLTLSQLGGSRAVYAEPFAVIRPGAIVTLPIIPRR